MPGIGKTLNSPEISEICGINEYKWARREFDVGSDEKSSRRTKDGYKNKGKWVKVQKTLPQMIKYSF